MRPRPTLTPPRQRPMRPELSTALVEGPVVLDGGLATQLEAHGADSAQTSGRPGCWPTIRAPSRRRMPEYFAAGPRSRPPRRTRRRSSGFARVGLGRSEAEGLIRRSVALARDAITRSAGDQQRWVAGSVGPYGAALADGSEYRGDYGLTVAELREWHRPRIAGAGRGGRRRAGAGDHPVPGRGRGVAGRGRRRRGAVLAVDDLRRGQTRAGEPAGGVRDGARRRRGRSRSG